MSHAELSAERVMKAAAATLQRYVEGPGPRSEIHLRIKWLERLAAAALEDPVAAGRVVVCTEDFAQIARAWEALREAPGA